MVQLLVDRGADVNAFGGQYGSLLQIVALGATAQLLAGLVDDVNALGGLLKYFLVPYVVSMLSFSAGLGWVITTDEEGAGETIAQGSKSLGTRQTAFDAEATVIEEAISWFFYNHGGHRALMVHSDSTSAIARASHTGAGPGQQHATRIHRLVDRL